MVEEIKKMPIEEFRRLGYIQEINRLLLHPCGLALEVTIFEDGSERLSGVWDYRDDPEGIIYDDKRQPIDIVKLSSVADEKARHCAPRLGRFGFVIQGPPTI